MPMANPIFYTVPKSWEAADSDGQRWRWAQEQAIENSPDLRTKSGCNLLASCSSNIGVQTMQMGGFGRGFFRGPQSDDDTKKDESGTYALHTLDENETIAKLASGIKRFKLPDEFNFIKIFQQVAAEPKSGARRASRSTELAANLRKPPPISQGGRLLAEEHRPVRRRPQQLEARTPQSNRRQLGHVRSGHRRSPPARGHGRFPLSQRQEGEVRRPRDQDRRAARRHEGVSQIRSGQSASTGTRSTSATSAIASFSRTSRNISAKRSLPGNSISTRGRTISTAASPSPRRCKRRAPIWSPRRWPMATSARSSSGWPTRPSSTSSSTARSSTTSPTPSAANRSPNANLEFFGWQQRHLGGNRFQVEYDELRRKHQPGWHRHARPARSEDRFSVARHRPRQRRSPRLPRLSRRLERQVLRRRIQRRSKSSRSPIGPFIAPIKR